MEQEKMLIFAGRNTLEKRSRGAGAIHRNGKSE